MKLLRYNLGLLLCLAAIFFYACDSDDESIEQNPKPTIKFKSGTNPITAYPGTELNFTVEMTGTAGIKKVVTMLNTQEVPGSTKDYPDQTSTGTYSVSYTVKTEEVGKTLNFRIIAYDKEDNKSTTEYTIYVQAAKPNIGIDIPVTAPESIMAGETVTFNIDVTSGAALKNIKTFLGETELPELRKETFENPNEDSYAFTYTSTDLDAGQTLTFTFRVMDANGGIVSKEYQISIIRAAEMDINEYQNIQVGAQSCATVGPFLNVMRGETYVRAGSTAKAADIDIALFYSNSTYGNYFAAPSDPSIVAIFKTPDPIAEWPLRNATTLKAITEMTSSDYLSISSKEMVENFYNHSAGEEVSKLTTKLAVGSIVGFKTAGGKYGIIMVKSIASGNAQGYMTLDIKVEK